MVRATAPNAATAEKAVSAAFNAIGRVQRLMSFHEPDSDVGQLNRHASRRAVRVHAWTCRVLRRAVKLHAQTGGLFDVTVASALVRAGWLPRVVKNFHGTGTSADIVFSPGNRIRFQRPLMVDLGGIAKGFAVDQAIAALQRSGANAGVVNAGGDLRIFGPRAESVHVRLPESPGILVPLSQVRNAAIATSAHYFAQRKIRGVLCGPICHPLRREFSSRACSVSVIAQECWLADALCKAVWLGGAAMLPVLRQHGARARILDAHAGHNPTEDFINAA